MNTPARPSFRRQLSLRYAASFCFLLLMLGVITWFNIHHCLVSSLDRNLLVIARSEAEFASQNGPLHLHHTGGVLPGSDTASLPRYVQISDTTGKVLVANHQLEPPLALAPHALAASLRGQPVFGRIDVQGRPFRILYLSLNKAGKAYVLQTATPLEPVDETLWQVMLFYMLSSLAMLALACWLGWRLANRAVTPLENITALAGRISLNHLAERIEIPATTPRELQDLSQMLNQMLERLEASAQALQQFTSDAAHELRTPLTILKGELQVALRKPRTAEEYRELLESNLDEVNRLIQLAEALLSLSRFEQQSSTGQLLAGQTELNQLARQMAEKCRGAVQEQQVGLEVETAPEAVWVAVHPTYLEQILYNLIDNALRVSATGARLQLNVAAAGSEALLAVRDQGPGISAEFQQRIFERFFQLDAARSGNRQHFGIGLSLCKAMIEVHRGRIELESQMGQGSTFRVILPRLAKGDDHPVQMLAQGSESLSGT